MRSTRLFFAPIFKILLFIMASVGGAQVLYSEVIFPGTKFLPFEIYNPILDMTKDRFWFRIIFLCWSFLLYLFLQFILSKHRWKELIIANEKHKIINFIKGSIAGGIFYSIAILFLALFFYQITEILTFSKDIFLLLVVYFITIIATAFFLELIFRATVLNYLKNFLNIHVANLITSTLFASIFVFTKSDYYPIKQFVFSLFLGYTFYKYGYYVTFGFHFGWDYLESFFFSNAVFKINIDRLPDFTPLTANSFISLAILSVGVIIYLFQISKKNSKKIA